MRKATVEEIKNIVKERGRYVTSHNQKHTLYMLHVEVYNLQKYYKNAHALIYSENDFTVVLAETIGLPNEFYAEGLYIYIDEESGAVVIGEKYENYFRACFKVVDWDDNSYRAIFPNAEEAKKLS